MTPSISFLITSIGRPSLKATLQSLVGQVIPGLDRIYVIFDGKCEGLDIFEEYKTFGGDLHLIIHPENLGMYGHGIRNFYQTRLEGDYIHHMDDDDTYLPGTIAQVREAMLANPRKIILVKFYGPGGNLVGDKHLIHSGEVGTPSGFFPNRPDKFAPWPMWYGGDGKFYEDTVRNLNDQFVWTDIILLRTTPSYHPEVEEQNRMKR